MKRTIRTLVMFLAAAATLVSCQKEDPALVAVSNGVLNGEFSVSPEKKVRFSQGNLQYQVVNPTAGTGVWNFADEQYSIIGNANSTIGATNTNAIDLFGWGTSGWSSGAVAYQPYSFSIRDNDYWPGGDPANNLTGNCLNADWGRNNVIMNGGMQAGAWRVLTAEEWDYLINGRPNAHQKMGVGSIETAHGMFLLPDNWTPPADTNIKFKPGLAPAWTQQFEYNNYFTVAMWKELEATGVVFLPAAGYRNVKTVEGAAYGGTMGNYWSSTAQRPSTAIGLHFTHTKVVANSYAYRHFGRAVRLVRDV